MSEEGAAGAEAFGGDGGEFRGVREGGGGGVFWEAGGGDGDGVGVAVAVAGDF